MKEKLLKQLEYSYSPYSHFRVAAIVVMKDGNEFIGSNVENASYGELIEITHEDPEWIKLSDDTYHAPIMNIENNILEYKKRYKGLIAALKI